MYRLIQKQQPNYASSAFQHVNSPVWESRKNNQPGPCPTLLKSHGQFTSVNGISVWSRSWHVGAKAHYRGGEGGELTRVGRNLSKTDVGPLLDASLSQVLDWGRWLGEHGSHSRGEPGPTWGTREGQQDLGSAVSPSPDLSTRGVERGVWQFQKTSSSVPERGVIHRTLGSQVGSFWKQTSGISQTSCK